MPRVGLLHSVNRQGTNSVDAELIHGLFGYDGLLAHRGSFFKFWATVKEGFCAGAPQGRKRGGLYSKSGFFSSIFILRHLAGKDPRELAGNSITRHSFRCNRERKVAVAGENLTERLVCAGRRVRSQRGRLWQL